MNNKKIIASFLAILMSISCLFNVAFAKTDLKGDLSKEKILLELDGKKIEENENGEIIVNIKDIKDGRGVLKYLGNKKIPKDRYGIWTEIGTPNPEAILLEEYDDDTDEDDEHDDSKENKCTSIVFGKKAWDTEIVYGFSDDMFAEYVESKDIIKKVKIKVVTDDPNYVDVSKLEKLIIQGKNYLGEPLYYKDEYIEKLKSICLEVEQLLKDKDIKKEQVDELINKLKPMIENPIKKEFDKTELNKIFKIAKSLNKEDYTKDSYELVKYYIEEIKFKDDRYQSQAEVNIYAEGLKKAIEQLADISKLRESIDDAQRIKKGTLSDDSWTNFQKVLKEAEDIYENKGNKKITRNEIEKIVKKLNSSISLLSVADKSSLKEAIKKLENIKESEFKLKSVNGKDKLLKEVQVVYTNSNATQVQINQAVKTIEEWLSKLEKKYVVYYKTISGQRINLDNSNSIELDLSQSGGKFCLEGETKLEGKKSIFWISDYTKRDTIAFTSVKDGQLYLNGIGNTTIELKFTDDMNYNKDIAIVTINLKVKDIPKIEDIKVYVGNKEFINKISIDGKQNIKLDIKAKFNKESQYVDVNRSIFNYYALNKKDIPGSSQDTGDKNSIIHLFNYNTDVKGIITSEMAGMTTMVIEFARDGIKKQIPVEVKNIPVEEIIFNVPTEYEYDELGFVPGSYNGIYLRNVLEIKPRNATYKGEVNLKFSDETIAIREKKYGDYIKPKKDGIVDVTAYLDTDGKHFEVTKRIKFYRKKKNVEGIQVTNDKVKVKIDEIIPVGIKTIPNDASNQEFEYKLSKTGIIKIIGNSIKGLNEGTVEILVKSKDESCKKQIKLTVTVLPKDKKRNLREEVRNTIKEVTPLIQQDTFNLGDEWNILGLARNNKNLISNEQKNNYLNSVIKSMKDKNNLSTESKPTNIEKVVIALSSLGIAADNINKENLLNNIYQNPRISDGLNESAFGLIALDTLNYKVTNDAMWTRNKLIEQIKKYQNSNGGFGLYDNETVSIDMTAMAVQALSTYKDREDIKPVIQKALNYLRNRQTEYGGFKDSGKENVESAAQVLVALTSLGIDPLSQSSEFGNENYNIITNILSYRDNNDGKFKHWKQDDNSNGMSTMQSYYALVSYLRFIENKGKLYDMTEKKEEVKTDLIKKDFKIENLTSQNEFNSGSNAKLTVKATNTTKDDKNVVLIVGMFNEDGKLVNYGAAEQTLKGSEFTNLTVNLSLDKKEKGILKAFIWDSLDKMTPLSDVIKMKVK